MAFWIWLNREKYSEYAKNDETGKFCMARFSRTFDLSYIGAVKLKVCADTRYMLYINDKFTGRGPISPGGDFISKNMTYCFYDEYEINTEKKQVEISAIVTSVPTALDESSFGYCGLYIEGVDKDGKEIFGTDEEWDAQLLSERESVFYTDYTKAEEPVLKASKIPDIHKMLPSLPEHLCEEEIYSRNFDTIIAKSGKSAEAYLIFDKIYAAYPIISVKTRGKTKVFFECSEIDEIGVIKEEFVIDCDTTHFSPRMRSIGQMKIKLESLSEYDAEIDSVKIISTFYPVKNETYFKSSDEMLNKIYDVCIHTLKICRQSLHLDSPTHREPLACTGDYYIESLMEYMNCMIPPLQNSIFSAPHRLLSCREGKCFIPLIVLYIPSGYTTVIYIQAIEKLFIRLKNLYAVCCLNSENIYRRIINLSKKHRTICLWIG